MRYAVKVHTTDRNVSAIMVIEAPDATAAKRAAQTVVLQDHPHVKIRSVEAELES